MFILNIAKKARSNYSLRQLRNHIVKTNHSRIDLTHPTADYSKYGFSFVESLLLNLNQNDYREYITTWEAYQPRMKPNPYFILSDDKYLFASLFGKFIEVPKTFALINEGKLIAIDEYKENEDLYDFILKRGGVVIKDRCGCDGFEVYVLYAIENILRYKNKEVSRSELLDIVKQFKTGIVQSVIEQGDFENAIFPHSINTVRVLSVQRKGTNEHEIIGAVQRIGTNKSAPVDNFNQGGGCALIDLQTGVLSSMTGSGFVNKEGNISFSDVHPDTGAQIKGSVIPHFKELKDTLVEITRKLPYFECIAWDVVVKDDGFALIETNMKSGLNVFQIHGGMRNGLIGQKYKEHGYLVDEKFMR